MSSPVSDTQIFVRPPRFELRMALLYASVFGPMGVHLPYFPLWLDAKGFSADQIAIILSAPMFLRVLTTPLITAAADRARDRAHVLVLVSLAALLISTGYFLTPTYFAVLAVSLALHAMWSPMSPLADSLALSGVRRFGSNYSGMRVWGSVAFLTGNFGGGLLLGALGVGAVPAIISIGLAVSLAMALVAPRLGPPRRASPLSAAALTHAGPRFFGAHFLWFAAGTGLLSGSHAFLYGFVSIYWTSIGLSETTIGLLWSWSVVAEVAVFMSFGRVFAHLPATTVLTVAALAAILRWITLPMIEPAGLGVAGFFASQTLHALSTGLMLIGVQLMIARSVPEERTGAAQGVAFFANGTSMAAGTLASGPLYAAFGIDGVLAMALVAGLALTAIRLAAAQPHSSGGDGETREPA
jgi:PPP family 3-phenylpropionic acid transporter